MTCISTSSESLSLSWYYLGADCADFGCRLCSSGPGMNFWVQTCVQQRAGKDFGCRLACRLLTMAAPPLWVHNVDHKATDSPEVVLDELRLLELRSMRGTQCATYQNLDHPRSWDIPFPSSAEIEIPKVGGKWNINATKVLLLQKYTNNVYFIIKWIDLAV